MNSNIPRDTIILATYWSKQLWLLTWW